MTRTAFLTLVNDSAVEFYVIGRGSDFCSRLRIITL
jgi:hypothetical protein